MEKDNRTSNFLKRFKMLHWQLINIGLIVYDVLAVNVAYFLALWFRFDCQVSLIGEIYITSFAKFAPIYTIVCIAVFAMLKLYRSIWRFASYHELMRVLTSSGITALFHTVAITLLFARMPISYYIIGAVFQFIAVLAVRFSYRFVLLLRSARDHERRRGGDRVMLVGAGVAGQMIIRDAHKAKEIEDQIICVIDDNPNKWGRYIEGVPIVGGRESIANSAKRYDIDKIYIALPSASAEDKRNIIDICKETDCQLKNLPGVYQLLNGEVAVSKMRPVSIEDLLGREEVHVNLHEIMDYVSNKVVLVTGGGGSIGSELCRQIAQHNPKRLVIFDIYENNAYEIQQELKRKYPDLALSTLIGSIRDENRLNAVFEKYQPHIVYHAAAHKHVPLMEKSPNEAIKNNVLGTYNLVKMADRWNVEKFVQISTDKAVNPTNIMGASKRVCEMIIQTYNEKSKTEYVAVRFGNVLGSNGSVIPLFKKQIENGGPVTVTHPDIIRYFMTIPEAVSLVLQAGSYAKGGEIFVLDMGKPVRIMDLAKNLIRLSGLTLGKDIEIQITGLRPGEKLYEELLMDEEGMTATPNKQIFIGHPIDVDAEKLYHALEVMEEAAAQETRDVRKIVEGIVTTYHPKEES